MKENNLINKTSFAPAERIDACRIITQSEKLKRKFEGFAVLDMILKREFEGFAVLDMIPDLAAVLNYERQLIFANQALIDFFGQKDQSSILGLRPGEMFGCVNAKNDSGGCGTTEFCRVCGAVNAILTTQKSHLNDVRECEITTKSGSYNFRVWTSPLDEENLKYTLFVARDIADEKYRESLEHIFFNDVINIGSGLSSLLKSIHGNFDRYQENHSLLEGLAGEMLDEISSQRDLIKAENGVLTVSWDTVTNVQVAKDVIEQVSKHQVAEKKRIRLEPYSEAVEFKTDKRLQKRILGNMAKNALEASAPGECVSLKTTSKDGMIVFRVHNDGFIPEDIQLQLFNRSFSTKGRGRGLGTYSIKLFVEKYLQGKVYFTSSWEDGTSFFVEYPIKPVID